MKIYLFRHGAVGKEDAGRFIGRSDRPLSAEGRAQAEAWRTVFDGMRAGPVAASPLRRAMDFARIVAGKRADAVTTCPDLAEIDLGDWEGRPRDEIRRTDPASWQARGADLAGFRPPAGESFADLQRRAVPAFESLADGAETNLLLVAHAGINRVILCRLLGMPLANLFRMGQDYGCLNVIELRPAGVRVRGINIPCPHPPPCV